MGLFYIAMRVDDRFAGGVREEGESGKREFISELH